MKHNGCIRIFVATDLHGSKCCFSKVVRAKQFFGADLVIIAGDLAPKDFAIIRRTPDQRHYRYRRATDPEWISLREPVALFRNNLSDAGCLSILIPDETELDDAHLTPVNIQSLFDDAFRRFLMQWRRIAQIELGTLESKLLWIPGNDDPFWIDEFLIGAPFYNLDRTYLDFKGARIIGLGGSNPTPWHTPREYTDEQISHQLSDLRPFMQEHLLIAVIHTPPFNCGLDMAPMLNDNLSYRLILGQPDRQPIGSQAVRKFVEEVQPLLLLTGHVHAARGVVQIGRTVCINPGSTYNNGILMGCIIDIADRSIESIQFTEG